MVEKGVHTLNNVPLTVELLKAASPSAAVKENVDERKLLFRGLPVEPECSAADVTDYVKRATSCSVLDVKFGDTADIAVVDFNGTPGLYNISYLGNFCHSLQINKRKKDRI